MKQLLASTFIAATIGIAPAYAGSEMAGIGPGFMTCAQFNAISNNGAQGKILAGGFYFWAQGFMSATNVGHAATGDPIKSLNSIPVEQQQRELRAYCLRNPADEYWMGVAKLYGELDDATTDEDSQ